MNEHIFTHDGEQLKVVTDDYNGAKKDAIERAEEFFGVGREEFVEKRADAPERAAE